MKTLLQNVAETVWKHVRLLDLWFLLLIGSTAQMHFTFVSQVHYQTGKMLQLHREDDGFIKEIVGMLRELNGMVGLLNEAQHSNVAAPADEAAIRSRVKALEEALGTSPEKAVVGLTLRKDFDNLQERYKSDIAAMRDEMRRSEDLYRWFLALMGLIAVAIVGGVVSRVYSKKE